MVRKAHAGRGQPQRGAGVQEACGQAAQAAVAQRRLVLELLKLGQVATGLGELRAHLVVQPQVYEVVAQELADQELRRDVVQALLALVVALLGRRVLSEAQQRVKKLELRALRKRLVGIGGEAKLSHDGFLSGHC